MKELDFYNKIKNWDFSNIKRESENLTNWNMYDILRSESKSDSIILDLGTGGGEKVIKEFPKAKKIIGTDLSPEMINTAKKNLEKSNREDITFRVMDNLKMDVENNYFDFIVARHTITDTKQIYKALKNKGKLLIRGVDKLDCWELKRLFKKGQAYNDVKPISLIDYENVLDAGFKNVELIPIHTREYYKTKEDLMALLYKTPILLDFSEENESNLEIETLDDSLINEYIEEHTFEKGILLIRRYYGITAEKIM